MVNPAPDRLSSSVRSYCLHQVNLSPDIEVLFHNCHKDSTQRKIKRAKREQLSYDEGSSNVLLDAFYSLQLATRRRHAVPPQPKSWFRNLLDCLGPAARIRIAYKGQTAIAAILTLEHNQTMFYKYGASDASHNSLGGTHMLLWEAIREARKRCMRVFDLGRSDHTNHGLVTFKDRWGSQRSELLYTRYTSAAAPKDEYVPSKINSRETFLRDLLARIPQPLHILVGELFYRHIG
jgi:lipid II:glycine glycyltransferase (peptidoglycan interpeptide bridge formation enzyme)